jgi:hypothetical protein
MSRRRRKAVGAFLKNSFINQVYRDMKPVRKTASRPSQADNSIGWQGTTCQICSLPNEVLYRLLGYMEARCELYRKVLSVILLWAITAPGWFGMAVVMGVAGQKTLAGLLLVMTPGVLILAGLAWTIVYFVWAPRRLFDRQMESIEQELQRRRRGRCSHILEN